MPAFVEVPTPEIRTYAEHFAGPHAVLVVASIAEGNTAAQLWRADQPSGAALLLWDKGNNVLYFAGAPLAEATQSALAKLVAAEMRPRSLAAGRSYFKVRMLPSQTEGTLPALFGEIELRQTAMLFWRLPDDAAQPEAAVAGIEIVPIDRSLFASDLAGLEDLKDEIAGMWPAPERFFERGFGCAALDGARLVCWCTSEYVSAEHCGIGIATDPAYQRRGIATATAQRFCRMARQRGITPHWECGGWNGASIRVAEKVGFARLAEERYWIGTFDA